MDALNTIEPASVKDVNMVSVDDKVQIVSQNLWEITQIVLSVVLCGLISLFGTIANLINMVIFYKQGLDTTINISFFCLAVSDLGSVIFQQCFNLFANPLFHKLDLPIAASEISYFAAGMPRETFSRITCLITVYITAERCLCIALPLHVKQLITPRRTSVVMVCIYLATVVSVVPLWYTTYIDWKFYPQINKTLLGLAFTDDREHVEGIVLVLHAILGTASFLAVVVFTMILIRKLSQKSSWRKSTGLSGQHKDATSNKDRTTMLTVILIAVILIVCYIPSAVLFLATFAVPDLSVSGKYATLFVLTWSFALLFETVNSSVNILLYWKMSTKYRATFRDIFSKCGPFISME